MNLVIFASSFIVRAPRCSCCCRSCRPCCWSPSDGGCCSTISSSKQQQADNRCEEAADLDRRALQQAVAATEEKLRDQEAMRFLATTPDSVSVTFADGQLEALPHGRLLYYPVALPGESAPDAAFEPGEALEHQRQDPAQAAEWFLQLARKAPAPVQGRAP